MFLDASTIIAILARESDGAALAKRLDQAPQVHMGDCFAYACARSLKASFLYKGTDFPQTDIEAA